MKTTEKDRLLNEVLRDDSYLAFRRSLFGGLLADLRRKRAVGTRRKLLAAAACIPIGLCIFFLMTERTRPPARQPATLSVVRTAPLPADQIVTTATAKGRVGTRPSELVFVTTTGSKIEIVRTGSSPTQTLSDQQLLDLFKGRPVALVFVAPNERRLVLLDEEEKR